MHFCCFELKHSHCLEEGHHLVLKFTKIRKIVCINKHLIVCKVKFNWTKKNVTCAYYWCWQTWRDPIPRIVAQIILTSIRLPIQQISKIARLQLHCRLSNKLMGVRKKTHTKVKTNIVAPCESRHLVRWGIVVHLNV